MRLCCSLSAKMMMLSMERFIPRFISRISPLTGAQNLIRSSFLSWNSTSPAFTVSPTSTTTLGIGRMPKKSGGMMAKRVAFTLSSIRSDGSPSSGISWPLVSLWYLASSRYSGRFLPKISERRGYRPILALSPALSCSSRTIKLSATLTMMKNNSSSAMAATL